MPVQVTYPGVYIEEVPSGVRTITGVATSITAFVGRALRGPVDGPRRINSYADYERRFGGLWRESTMSYAVRDFYQNGGSAAIIVRLHNSAAPATIDLGTIKLEADNPGDWGENLQATVDYNTADPSDTNLFNLAITDTGTGAAERFLNVSIDPDAARSVDKVLAQESQLVNFQGTLASGTNRPAVVADKVAETDGDDGSELTPAKYQGNQGQKTGIYQLEKVDLFNLLCIPPISFTKDVSDAVLTPALSYCVDRRSVLLVDAPQSWVTKDAAVTGMGSFALSGASATNAALYFPRLRAPDPLQEGRLADFPPCGAVAGVIARTDVQRGVWKAPAGLDASVTGAVDLTVALTDEENGELNSLGVNCLRSFPVIGRVVWGGRTLRGADALASEWKYLPVRRTALFIEESLYRGTQWVVFEPNDEPLWAQIRLNLGAFMHTLFRQGAFQGTSPREAYFVKCDHETTTQTDINNGIVNILVGFAPLKPAEFVIIRIQQMAGQEQQ